MSELGTARNLADARILKRVVPTISTDLCQWWICLLYVARRWRTSPLSIGRFRWLRRCISDFPRNTRHRRRRRRTLSWYAISHRPAHPVCPPTPSTALQLATPKVSARSASLAASASSLIDQSVKAVPLKRTSVLMRLLDPTNLERRRQPPTVTRKTSRSFPRAAAFPKMRSLLINSQGPRRFILHQIAAFKQAKYHRHKPLRNSDVKIEIVMRRFQYPTFRSAKL